MLCGCVKGNITTNFFEILISSIINKALVEQKIYKPHRFISQLLIIIN